MNRHDKKYIEKFQEEATMEERMIRILKNAWRAIAEDMEEGKYYTGKDAGNMAADFIGTHGGDAEAEKEFWIVSPKERDRLIKLAFPLKGKVY